MKTAIIALIFLGACTPLGWKVAEDIVKGEEQIMEQVGEDVTGAPAKK